MALSGAAGEGGNGLSSALQAAATIRVLIADDVPELRTVLRLTMQGRGFELVGEAGSSDEVLRLAAEARPELVVLDLAMPGGSVDTVVKLRERLPDTKVVVLSALTADKARSEVLQGGATAYLEKTIDPEGLVTTLRELCGRGAAPVPVPARLTGLFEPSGDDVERIWSSLSAAPTPTAVVDGEGRLLRVNQALAELVGQPEVVLLSARFPAVLHPDDRDADLEQLHRLLAGELPAFELQQRCRRSDGEAVPVLGSAWLPLAPWGDALHRDRAGQPRFVIRQLVDLRDHGRPDERFAWRVTHDALTGLPNRTLFLDRLRMSLARLGREPGLAAVLAVDLDRFSEMVERFGDDAVDRLLIAVAGRLRSILRPSDTVARFSGDDFAVLCPIAHQRDAVRLAERVLSGLTTPIAVAGQEVVLQASIGIAVTGPRAQPPETLLLDADIALQRAKQHGGRYELADETLRAQLAEQLETERALRQALDAGELRALYQPIVSLREGRLVGAAALGAARAGHPAAGRVPAVRGGDRPDRADRRVDPAGGVPPGGPLAYRRRRGEGARRGARQPLRAPVRRAAPGRQPGDGRDHPEAAGRPGRAGRGGRLRHRLVVACLAAVAAGHDPQDRPLLRGPPRPGARRRHHGRRGHRPGPHPRAQRHRHRRRDPGSACQTRRAGLRLRPGLPVRPA